MIKLIDITTKKVLGTAELGADETGTGVGMAVAAVVEMVVVVEASVAVVDIVVVVVLVDVVTGTLSVTNIAIVAT